MVQLDIQSMTPKDILRKESFRRAKPLDLETKFPGGSPDYDSNASHSPIRYTYPTQDDFLREYDVTSHAINSIAYYPNLIFVAGDGAPTPSKVKAKIRTRTAVAWQARIHTKRVIALTGYDPDITIARTDTGESAQRDLARFKEGWMLKNMDCGVGQAISADLKVADTAFCGYLDNGKFGYRVFSYDKGDTLYPHYDPMTGRLKVFGRKFRAEITNDKGETETISYLDVWDEANYIQYRTATLTELERNPKDEWVVSVKPKKHNYHDIPVAYHRYGAPCWANSQDLCDQYELAISQLAENNAQYALRILYALGAEFDMEGTVDGTPTMINSTDPNAKIGFLEPADSSKSFELQLNTLAKEIMRCSFAVETPEIKSGSDISSLTVKALMADSYLKAVDDAREYQPFLDEIVRIFIDGYGVESELRSQFLELHVRAKLQPWVFLSETEVVSTVVQLVTAGVLSKQSATEYIYETLGLGTVDEAKRILQEAHDELLMNSEGAATTTAGDETLDRQTHNPVNDTRRLIAENALDV